MRQHDPAILKVIEQLHLRERLPVGLENA